MAVYAKDLNLYRMSYDDKGNLKNRITKGLACGECGEGGYP